MDYMSDLEKDFLHLARLSFEGKKADTIALTQKVVREIIKRRPDLSSQVDGIMNIVRSLKDASLMRNAAPIPVDLDSRLELVWHDTDEITIEPFWVENVKNELDSIVEERKREQDLIKAGLFPTKTILLVGPPGVGKTLSAKWIAAKLNRPLLVLDLAAVMSSYLGKTGNNIRAVLEYAKKRQSVLLLDEFDAIAKKRDDSNEVGELKRLVTVLLQAVDSWPSDGILLAATNHPELLDSAIWRRFDKIINFPKPNASQQESYISKLLDLPAFEKQHYLFLLSSIYQDLSYAEIEKNLNSIQREVVMENITLKEGLDRHIARRVKDLDSESRLSFARLLNDKGCSQRKIQELTGCSRDTLRIRKIGTKTISKIASKKRGKKK